MTPRSRRSGADSADDAVEPSTRAAASHEDAPDDEPKSSGTRYLNVSGSPLVYDKEGHSVGAGEWTPEVNLDAIGQTARSQDYLLPPSALS